MKKPVTQESNNETIATEKPVAAGSAKAPAKKVAAKKAPAKKVAAKKAPAKKVVNGPAKLTKSPDPYTPPAP